MMLIQIEYVGPRRTQFSIRWKGEEYTIMPDGAKMLGELPENLLARLDESQPGMFRRLSAAQPVDKESEGEPSMNQEEEAPPWHFDDIMTPPENQKE